MKPQIKYFSTKQYKYELATDYQITVKIRPASGIYHQYFILTTNGLLTIKEGYMWDGPSGPTIDTKDFMRGSLIHDVLAQMMRMGLLDYKVYKKSANEELIRICIEDGMWRLRTKWVYLGVSITNDWCKPKLDRPEWEIITAP